MESRRRPAIFSTRKLALILGGFFAVLAVSTLQLRAQNAPNTGIPGTVAAMPVESPNHEQGVGPHFKDYQGSGPINTDPFTITGAWNLHWYSESPLSIAIAHLDGSADEPVVQQQEPGQGTLLETKPGTFFLKITSTDQWNVWLTPVPEYVPAAGTPTTPQALLTADQTIYQNCIVLVKGGDNFGIGFLVKKDQATYVVVRQRLVSNNANLSFLTTQGIELKPLSIVLAPDRDLAMMKVNDPGTLVTIPCSTTGASSVRLYDDIFEPGFKQGMTAVPDNYGKIQMMGPLHLGVAAPLYTALRGTPLVDIRTKSAIGVVTETEVPLDLQQRAYYYRESTTLDIAYDALRLDNVANWEPSTVANYYAQTHFIESFHEETVEIRSFLDPWGEERRMRRYVRPIIRMPGYIPPNAATPNPAPKPQEEPAPEPDEPFRKNSKLVAFYDQMHGSSNLNADVLAVNVYTPLNELAQEGVSTIQKPALFNSYNRTRALEELGLRNTVLGQIHDLLNAGKQSLLNPVQ